MRPQELRFDVIKDFMLPLSGPDSVPILLSKITFDELISVMLVCSNLISDGHAPGPF
jgi:hypothetical protein